MKKFINIFNKIPSHCKNIPEKYKSLHDNYRRLFPLVSLAKQHGYKNGLDFGCASCFVSIIGRLEGLEIAGIDIPYIKEGKSSYISLQKYMASIGYRIIIRDTTVLPWNEFKDNEFEFIIASWSISKDFKRVGFNKKDRLSELIRITNYNGSWIISPLNHYRKLTQVGWLDQKSFDEFNKELADKKISIKTC